MLNNIDLKSLSDEELDILIELQEKKVKDIKDQLKNELIHLKELMKKLEESEKE